MAGGMTKSLAIEAVEPDLRATDRDGVLRELAALLVGETELEEVVEALKEREAQGTTAVGGGVAIPHVRLASVRGVRAVFGRSRAGVDFGAVDGKPVDLIFLILTPEGGAGEHLRSLARASRLLRTPGICKALREATTREEFLGIIASGEEEA